MCEWSKIICLLGLLVSQVVFNVASACDCLPEGYVTVAAESSRAVFIGTVISDSQQKDAFVNTDKVEFSVQRVVLSRKVGFRLALPEGKYCVSDDFQTCNQLNIATANWVFAELNLP